MSSQHIIEVLKLKTKIQVLSERLKSAERARDHAEKERDAWRMQAERLLGMHCVYKKPYLLTLDKKVG